MNKKTKAAAPPAGELFDDLFAAPDETPAAEPPPDVEASVAEVPAAEVPAVEIPALEVVETPPAAPPVKGKAKKTPEPLVETVEPEAVEPVLEVEVAAEEIPAAETEKPTKSERPVALVTGAGRGIGRGIAIELARLGWAVVVNYAGNVQAADECLAIVREAGGDGVTCKGDVSVEADRENLLRTTLDTYGRIDLLVNNAGVAPNVRADILDAGEESFDRLIDINLKGPYFLTQRVARQMIAQQEAGENGLPPQIVTITSVSAYTASTNRGDYCISKAGLGMMTALWAARLAPHGIYVYEIRPGVIATDMTGGVKEKYDKMIADGAWPIKRWGEPSDVGRAVAAIARGDFPFSTGEVFNVGRRLPSEDTVVVMPPAPTLEARERSARRTLWWIGGIAGGVLLLIVARIISGNIEPRVSLPTPVLPKPNAFDVFVRAGKQCAPTKEAQDTLFDMVSRRPKKTWTLAQKEAFLRKNTLVLQTLRGGLSMDYVEPPNRSLDAEFPFYADFRHMVRLLVLEGNLHRAKGENNSAMESYLDAFLVGQKIPRGAQLLGDLVGIACQAVARRSLWETLPHLNAREAKTALRQMEVMQEDTVPFTDTLREEKYQMQACLMDIFRNNRSNLNGKSVVKSPDRPRFVYFVWSKHTMMRGCETYMDKIIARSQQPYQTDSISPALPMPRDPMNQILLPPYDKARLKAANNETQNSLLIVALALHAYKMEHKNRYPSSLSDLCPAYLPEVPNDPFAISSPLLYESTQTHYVLHSIGPDGKDDKGVPISDYKPTSGPASAGNKHLVSKDSKGDIVAGINQ